MQGCGSGGWGLSPAIIWREARYNMDSRQSIIGQQQDKCTCIYTQSHSLKGNLERPNKAAVCSISGREIFRIPPLRPLPKHPSPTGGQREKQRAYEASSGCILLWTFQRWATSPLLTLFSNMAAVNRNDLCGRLHPQGFAQCAGMQASQKLEFYWLKQFSG